MAKAEKFLDKRRVWGKENKMSNYGNMLGGTSRQILNRMKNFSYHIAFHFLRDEERAEKVVIETMTRLAHYEHLMPEGWEGSKYFIGLLTCQIALVFLRKDRGRLDRSTYRELFADPSDFHRTGNRIYDLEKAVDCLNFQDQIILAGKVCLHLSDENLGAVLHLRPSAVSRRVNQSLLILGKRVPRSDRRPYQPEDPAIQQALFFKLKEKTNRIEALANLNKHSFSQSFERKAVQSIASGKSGSFFERLFDLFKNQKTSVYAIGISVFLLLVIAALLQTREPKDQKAELTNQPVKMEEEQPSLSKKDLPSSYYALYDTTTLIVDPDTLMVYEALQGGEVKRIYKLEEPVKANGKIMHIGKVDEMIYVAFANGKGGSIQGQPAEFTLTPYWESAWFRNQKKREEENQEIVVDKTAYRLLIDEKE